MIRRWAVPPQHNGMVSREELIQAIMDGESMLWRAGGVLTILVGREPTGLPGEMLTTQAVVEWKDRTDARPQPEREGGLGVPETEAPTEAVEPPAVVSDEPDGLDVSKLEEEDLSAIPPALR